MISNVSQTSREALASISTRTRHTQNDDVFAVVAAACGAGVADMTGQEIMLAYRARFDREMYPNVISRVVGSLVDGGRLVRITESRACTVSGKNAYPVTVPAKQERMFY